MQRVGIFSDVHSNIQALESLFATESVDIWLNAGDFVGLFPRVNETTDFLRSHKVISVLGNHEDALLDNGGLGYSFTAQEAITKQQKVISDTNRNYIHSLKHEEFIQLSHLRILLTHKLTENESKYKFDAEKAEKLYPGFEIVIFGDTHLPFILYSKNTIYLNPGSLGFPISPVGKGSYLIFDCNSRIASLKFLELDKDGLLEDVKRFQYNTKLSDYINNNFKWERN